MSSLVVMDKNDLFTTSSEIAEGVGNKHHAILQLLEKYKTTEILSSIEKTKVKTKGRPLDCYMLTELQATFVITLMKNSPKVVQFKERLSKEFFKQRNALQKIVTQRENEAWKAERADGKQIYMQKTDVIKIFVDYASEQGSKSANLYYMNFAKMENKSLFLCHQKLKNVREMLNIRQLNQIACADQIIEKAIQNGMDEEMNYKDVYRMAKAGVLEFAELIGTSPILALTEQPEKETI